MNRIPLGEDNQTRVLRVARESALFAPMPDADLQQILNAPPQRLGDGERIFSQGDRAERFYLVVDGQVKLHRLTASGAEHIVNIMGAGDTFGEAVMFFRRPVFPVTAEAVKGALICPVDNARFYAYLESHASLCLTMLGEVCIRLHARLNEVSQIRLKNAEHRLAWFLLDQVQGSETATAELRLPLAKKYLASRLSMMPETLSRAIARLTEMGLLRVHRDRFVLTDIPSLRAVFRLDG